MAFTQNNQTMNPFTGSQPSQSRAPAPMAPSPGVGGMTPQALPGQPRPAGPMGPQKKKRVGRRNGSKTQGVAGLQRRMHSQPEAAPLPVSPISSSSSPLGVDWASSRSFGNGGYA